MLYEDLKSQQTTPTPKQLILAGQEIITEVLHSKQWIVAQELKMTPAHLSQILPLLRALDEIGYYECT